MATSLTVPSLLIGSSAAGRPLLARFYGDPDAPVRVLLICGQHGDERGVRRALARFETSAEAVCRNCGVHMAILPDLNPDGAALRTRPNAQGIDLNRDHVLLRAPETEALHRFARSWSPHLTVDLHNYPSRRKHLVEQGLRLGWDVALDYPTHPAAPLAGGHWLLDTLEEGLRQMANQHGFRYGRYGLLDDAGSLRHGTPRLGDARNTLSLRLDVPVLLLEARNPARSDASQDKQKVRDSVRIVLQQIVRWVSVFGSQWRSMIGKPLDRVPLGYRRPASGSTVVPVAELGTGLEREWPAVRYRPLVQGRRCRAVPAGYWTPDHSATARLICRHGYTGIRASGGWIFPVDQPGGRLLMLLLDPESKTSLSRSQGFALDAKRWWNEAAS